MQLLDIPPELIIWIAKTLNHKALARFVQTNRCVFNLAMPVLLDSSKHWRHPTRGISLLHWAAEHDRATLIDQLLERNVIGVDEIDHRGYTALDFGAQKGYIDVVQLLLAKGASVTGLDGRMALDNLDQWHPRTALQHAAEAGHTEIVQLLAEHGMDISGECSCVGPDGEIPRHRTTGGHPTPLQLATNAGHAETVARLIDLGARLEEARVGFVPLHIASFFGYVEVLQVILEKGRGIDVNLPSAPDGATALHKASWVERSVPCIAPLLAHGANPAAGDESGRTPLHWAGLKGTVEAARLLLSSGAVDVNVRDRDHRATPLHWAAIGSSVLVVEYLLQNGADATIGDRNGQTALDWAREGSYVGSYEGDRVTSMLVNSIKQKR